jgi:hypothetical protein
MSRLRRAHCLAGRHQFLPVAALAELLPARAQQGQSHLRDRRAVGREAGRFERLASLG